MRKGSNDTDSTPPATADNSAQEEQENDPYYTSSAGESPWKPAYLFVYGSLMDPDVIQKVLRVPSPPSQLSPARLPNFKMKMWSIYPTLIPSETGEDVVQGRVFLVEEMAQFRLLEMYETDAYTWREVEVELLTGGKEQDSGDGSSEKLACRVFVWAGDPNSKLLEDGTFDLERYQRYFKPSVMS